MSARVRAEVAVVVDHRAQVEELLADYRRSREQLGSMQKALAAITESVTSDDGLVTVTVGAQGTLTGLTISDHAYQRLRPSELARLIVHTAGTAAARSANTAHRTVSPLLPQATDPAALLAGRADLRMEEITPDRPAEDDDESYEDRSWLENRGRPS
jgi:DNA-binding protein YbaB